MIARVHRGSAGFGGVVDSLLAARTRTAPNPIPDDPAAPRPPAGPSHARVAWTDTRNLPTFDPRRAGRVMRATAAAAPELKRLAGVPPGGRPLLRPVYHLTLCWAVTDSPSRVEMERAAAEALRQLQNTHDRAWRRLFHRQERAREDLDRAGHSLAGRIGQWRASGRRWKDLPAAIRGKPQLLGRWQRQLAQQQTVERGLLTRDEAARARGLEQALGRTYERSTRLQMEQAAAQERSRRERTRQPPEMTWAARAPKLAQRGRRHGVRTRFRKR